MTGYDAHVMTSLTTAPLRVTNHRTGSLVRVDRAHGDPGARRIEQTENFRCR